MSVIDSDGYIDLRAIQDFGLNFNKAMRAEKEKTAEELVDEA